LSKQFVKDLKRGALVQSQFAVVDVKVLPYSAPSRAGEYFLRILLGDVSGTIKSIIWDRSMVNEPITVDDVLYVTGEVKEYQGLQLVINSYEKMDKKKIEREHFQVFSDRDPAEMWESLQKILAEKVQDKKLTDLLNVFYNDKEMVDKFILSPAAKTIHHNYLGGLLEHTLEVVELCVDMADHYPKEIDRSVLVMGALFHDIGKIEEYNLNSVTFQQTDRGRLLGHITIGHGMLKEKIGEVGFFPERLKMNLEHIILSHHGEKEWGSPEIPQTFEAFTLFHADLLSARLKQFQQVLKKSDDSPGWTEWDRFLERRVYHQDDICDDPSVGLY